MEKNPGEGEAMAKALKWIKAGWILGIISTLLTLAITLYSMAGHNLLGFNAWYLIDVGFTLGLTYGIYRRSRACAIIMLIYIIESKVLILPRLDAASLPSAIFSSGIVIFFYSMAVWGTISYHRLLKQQAAASKDLPESS